MPASKELYVILSILRLCKVINKFDLSSFFIGYAIQDLYYIQRNTRLKLAATKEIHQSTESTRIENYIILYQQHILIN